MIDVEGIDHVALSVSNVKRSAQWYIDVLGFERRHEGMWDGIPTFVVKGTTAIAFFPANTEARSVRQGTDSAWRTASPRDRIRMRHLAFRASRKNFLLAQEELERRGIDFEFSDHEIAHSIYFEDPDGHILEITTYEL